MARTRISGDAELLEDLGSFPAVNPQVDSYTAVSDDRGCLVTIAKGTAVNFTIPADIFAVGTVLAVMQLGAGAVTVVAGSGSTVNVDATFTKVTAGQYSVAYVICYAANAWVVRGDLVAA